MKSPFRHAETYAGVVRRPWFDRRPRAATGLACALFAVILLLCLQVRDARDDAAMLYVLPVALVAMTKGRRGGFIAGVVAVVLLAAWQARSDAAFAPIGWATRALPLVMVGVLIGAAADRRAAAELAERRAAALELLRLEGAEVNDHIVQKLAAAKWAIEAGDTDRALGILDDAMVTGQHLVTSVLGTGATLNPREHLPH